MPGAAFPKSARLLTAKDFTQVLAQPDVNLSSGPLRLRARKNRMHTARLGVVVPKKGTPHAHRRNRIKRLIREEFRNLRADLPAVDVVVQVFGEIDDRRLSESLRKRFRELAPRMTDE